MLFYMKYKPPYNNCIFNYIMYLFYYVLITTPLGYYYYKLLYYLHHINGLYLLMRLYCESSAENAINIVLYFYLGTLSQNEIHIFHQYGLEYSNIRETNMKFVVV